MCDFDTEYKILSDKLSPLLLKLSEEFKHSYDFNDSEYYYNNQIEYHNHVKRLEKYCNTLEDALNKYMGFVKKTGLLSKFLSQRNVYVKFNITSDMYVRIYVPVFKKGTREYVKYLVLDKALRHNPQIDGVTWLRDNRVYSIDSF